MNNVSITPADIMACCNLILVLAAVVALIANLVKKANAPNERQDKKISEVEKRVDGHDKDLNKIWSHLDMDKHRLDDLESEQRITNRVIIQTLQVLVRHGIDGNNRDELIEADKALNSYLLNERWGHAEKET